MLDNFKEKNFMKNWLLSIFEYLDNLCLIYGLYYIEISYLIKYEFFVLRKLFFYVYK